MNTVSSYVTPGISSPPRADYGDPRLGWLLIVLLLAVVVIGVGYIAIYLGVEYGIPSWGAHAYPPPLVR